MTTAIDTNIIVSLWDKDTNLSSLAKTALDSALQRGGLIISTPVFAELVACPGRNEIFLDSFLRDTGITVDWELGESVWREAGRAFQAYAARRRKQGGISPRRILADFLIGAHALGKDCELLTLDDYLYGVAFPRLKIVRV
jgi:predicted nucleic acid-binding protein